jgi:peptide/nickel transport system substrate-binding protein
MRLRLFSLILLGWLTACTGTVATTTNPYRIVYGLTLSVSGIDPHINQNTELGIVLRQVYDTLLYRDPDTKEIVAGLATEWSVSPDGLVYTFKLRNDVVFHDGTLFNAAAVAANLERIMSPETASQKARLLLGTLSSYEIVDEFTIRLILSQPYTPFLDALCQIYLGIASPKALQEYSLLRYQYHQVGTGPFEFVEYVPEDRIVIRRNPNYTWGPRFYGAVPENAIQEVEFRFYRDPATRAAALESGEVQIMGELLPADARLLANNAAFQVFPVPIPGQPLQFYMNIQRPPTDNLAVRQALLYGMNRNAIVDVVYQGFSPVAWGPIAREVQFYNPGVVNAYAYDLEQAQGLLAGSGYTDTDNDNFLDLNGEPLTITVLQPPWGLVPEVTQLLFEQWTALGIQVVINPVPGFTALKEQVDTGEFHLVAFDTTGYDPSLLMPRFTTGGAANWIGYSNPQLDAIFQQATTTQDLELQRQLYGQAQAIIMQEALILPIRDYVNLNGATARLQGLRFDPYGWFPLLYGVTITG